MPLKKIVLVGPESTGKSTLCEGLAAFFSSSRPTAWVPEYARAYLLEHGMNYAYTDLITIAQGQLALEEEHSAALEAEARHSNWKKGSSETPLLFIDTDMYVMKVWSEFVFGRCEPWILDQIALRRYDGYLLCNTDLPWVKDELREYPDFDSRERLFHIYKDSLVHQSTPWAEIRGEADQRLLLAIDAVTRLLKQ